MIEMMILLGLSNKEIKEVTRINRLILEEEELRNIDILKVFGCKDEEVKNIIVSNPYYLTRSFEDIVELLKYFINTLKIESLNYMLDSNPLLLSREKEEIEFYVNKCLSEGLKIDEVSNIIESNPFVLEEM